jgi:hypothetical protein
MRRPVLDTLGLEINVSMAQDAIASQNKVVTRCADLGQKFKNGVEGCAAKTGR